MTTSLVIEPVDVLLFRDGKPFTAGMDHTARSLFPPLPSTIAGFLRSKLLHDAGFDWQEARRRFGDLGDPADYGSFRLESLFLRKGGVDFVPVPGDVARIKGRGDDRALIVLRPIRRGDTPSVASNFPMDALLHLGPVAGEPMESAVGFVTLADLFGACLRGAPPTTVFQEENFVCREPRTGIGVDTERLTAGDGRLFTVEFLRLLGGVGFHARFSGVTWPGPSGADTLGGERRPVRWAVLDDWTTPETGAIDEKVRSTRRFKVVLLTPAVFEAGWRPGSRFEQVVADFGVEVGLVAAAVGRPVPAGGFDLARQRPKPMRPAAPAGSVYFYEIRAGDPSALVSGWRMRAISDNDWEAGMGVSVLGGWDHA